MRSGRRETPVTSTGGTFTRLDGAFSLVGGGTDGAVLCAPIIGMVLFFHCMLSIVYVTAREATAVEITPSSRNIDVRCHIVYPSFQLCVKGLEIMRCFWKHICCS
jgi:hypothetical protein